MAYHPPLDKETREQRKIEWSRRANARKQGIEPDEGYMALQVAKADALAQKRAERLARYEAHLAKQEGRK